MIERGSGNEDGVMYIKTKNDEDIERGFCLHRASIYEILPNYYLKSSSVARIRRRKKMRLLYG